MPKIPIYESQTNLQVIQQPHFPMQVPSVGPGPLIDPQKATSGLQEARKATMSLIQSYDTISKIGNNLTQIGERFDDIYQTGVLNKTKVIAADLFSKKLVELQDSPDFQNIDQKYRDFTEKTKKDLLKDSPLHGQYLSKFEAHYDADAITSYPKVMAMARTKAVDFQKATLNELVVSAKQRIAEAETPERAETIKKDTLGEIQRQIATGVLHHTEGFEMSQKFLSKLDDADAMRLVNGVRNGSMKFEDAKSVMDNPGKLINLDPIMRIKYQDKLDVANNQHRVEREKALVDGAYNVLYDHYNGDPDLAIKYLQDPGNQKALGLRVDQAKEVQGYFIANKSYVEHQAEKLRKENAEKSVNAFWLQVNKGQPADALQNLKKDADFGIVPQKAYADAKDMLTKPADVKTDSMTYVTLEDKVLRGEASSGEIILKGGISKSDKASLLSKLYTRQDRVQTEAEREAKTYIQHQIITTGMLGNPIPAEWDRVHKANNALDYWSDQAKKAGKPWTYQQYQDYAKQLVETFRTTPQTKINDMQNMMKSGTPAMPSPPRRSTTVPTGMKSNVRLPGESIDAYEKRMGR